MPTQLLNDILTRQGGKASVRRKLLASANLGNHQIEETDNELIDAMVAGGLPILNGGTEVDASTIFRRRKSEDILRFLPKSAEVFPQFWSEELNEEGGKQEQATLFAAGQLRRTIARGGNANFFVRATGDASEGPPEGSKRFLIRAPNVVSLANEFQGRSR